MNSLPLVDTAHRLAAREGSRTEADLQADLAMFLHLAPLDLGEEQIRREAPVSGRRRIDVEVGLAVFECKKDLRVGNERSEGIPQLAGYVADRQARVARRYVGVLTDGVEWHLYHLADDQLSEVSNFELRPEAPDVEGLVVWLEGVLATEGRIHPTPEQVRHRLGADSPAYALDRADLHALWEKGRSVPAVRLKRALWARLLTTALGTAFSDDDRLFVEHTLLVASAAVIGHAVMGFDLRAGTITPSTLLTGQLFAASQIRGVIESDFFAWVLEVDGGDAWVKTLARRLARFAWEEAEHDVMKVLYESVIAQEERRRLGEYYTPDWLADEIVRAVVPDPLTTRVLDPACGSGTFLFHAVRHYLGRASDAGQGVEAVGAVGEHVLGMDIHPVAVTLARVTYLLAIGRERLLDPARPPITVPVYLGDSMQWNQDRALFSHDVLRVPTGEGNQLFESELQFPNALLADADRFDELVAELADRASDRPRYSPVPDLTGIFRRFAIAEAHHDQLRETFATMCRLQDEGRNHIWGYYVRNLARPAWLEREANRVDVLVGNPPWLSYRYMPAPMQAAFAEMSRDRKLWAGAAVATHQDLSGLFVVRCAEQYLRLGGRLGFVMPLATLSRRQFTGFRRGSYEPPRAHTHLAFDMAWDLHLVKPSFFPVPGSVVFGTKVADGAAGRPLDGAVEEWSGRLPGWNLSRQAAAAQLTRTAATRGRIDSAPLSPYQTRFAQGATVVPRVLLVVEADDAGPFGAGAGRLAVRSRRSPNEKAPWKTLDTLRSNVETQFVRPLLVGDTVLPFRLRPPQLAVIPHDGKRLLDGDVALDQYPGLASWWRSAEQLWNAHRSGDRLTLLGQLDYRRKLGEQFPPSAHRVVYSASGMYLAAAYVTDQRAVIEHALYWGSVSGPDEARYLIGILNSDELTRLLRPLQARGEHNPRHFDKYVFQLRIPTFDPTNDLHRRLVALAERAEQVAGAVELPTGTSFQALRRRVRSALATDGVAGDLDDAVRQLLAAITA